MGIISIEHLKKYYGVSRGVEDVSIEVKKGEILGFIGPNGSGKSTVIRIIMGLIKKTSGSVSVFDEDPSFTTNERIGYLPSEIFLYSELTVEEQLDYFATIRGVKKESYLELANILDLDITRKIAELSFGNKKKVGIVSALMHDPELIILDEPTSGLDPLIQQKFLELLLRAKKRGASILLSSHVLTEVEKVCDRIALIKDGKILFSQSLATLRQSTYKKVYICPKIDIKLDTIVLIKEEPTRFVYSYRGDVNKLVKTLSNYNLKEISIVDLDLDEIFMHYYNKEESHD